MIIDCPVCKKPCKNLTSHMRAQHPDYQPQGALGPPPPPAPPAEAEATPPVPDYSEVIAGLMGQLEAQGKVIAQLNQRLEEMGQSTAQVLSQMAKQFDPTQIDLMVQQRVDQAASEFMSLLPRGIQSAQGDQSQAPGVPSRSSRFAEIAAIAQALGPLLGVGQQAQPNLSAIQAQFAAFKSIADLFQAPYSNGVRDTLNMITTAYKVGVPVENLSEAFKKMAGAEEKKSE